MRREIEDFPEIADEDGSITLCNRFLTNESIIKKLIESEEDFPVTLIGMDRTIVDKRAPKEQQKDHFSTSESLRNGATEGFREIDNAGPSFEGIILVIRPAHFLGDKTEIAIAIVEQSTEKGLQKAWYCLSEYHHFKPGDHVLVMPVTEHYSSGDCETYHLTLK
jgi:hypothetical protein